MGICTILIGLITLGSYFVLGGESPLTTIGSISFSLCTGLWIIRLGTNPNGFLADPLDLELFAFLDDFESEDAADDKLTFFDDD